MLRDLDDFERTGLIWTNKFRKLSELVVKKKELTVDGFAVPRSSPFQEYAPHTAVPGICEILMPVRSRLGERSMRNWAASVLRSSSR